MNEFSGDEEQGFVRLSCRLGVIGLKAQCIMEEANHFLEDGVRLIEGEFFDFIEDGGVGDDCNVEGVSDRCR